VALAAALGWQVTNSSAQPLEQAAPAGQRERPTTMVTIFDNDAPTPQTAFDPEQGFWGFGPHPLLVRERDTILFVNPSTNQHPHTVTSLERVGSPFENRVNVGTLFDSSPTNATILQPGQSFTLDTRQAQPSGRALPPGNYTYFCKLHPWMVAEFTVTDQRLR
jgi:plastocyanin